MWVSQSIRRVFKHSKRKVSGNSYQRSQLRSARDEFVPVESDFICQIRGDHCANVIVWHMGLSGTCRSVLVSLVQWEQIVCLYDGLLRWKYVRGAGEFCDFLLFSRYKAVTERSVLKFLRSLFNCSAPSDKSCVCGAEQWKWQKKCYALQPYSFYRIRSST